MLLPLSQPFVYLRLKYRLPESKSRSILPATLIQHLKMSFVSTFSIHAAVKQNIHTIPECISILQSLARQSFISKGKELHSWMLRHNLLTSPSTTSLINMYSKCNHMSYALSVFESSGSFRNVYTYNAVIAGFVGNNMYDQGFKLYLDMRYQGVSPDKFTFPCVIKGCSEVVEMRKIHALLFKCGLDLNDEFITSTLVTRYLKFYAMNDAYKVFHDLPVRDVVVYNAMINGYAHIGEYRKAFGVFNFMMSKGEATPNNITIRGSLSALSMSGDIDNGYTMHGFVIKKGYESVLEISNALIDMYGKCKRFDDAILVFNSIEMEDIFSWNTLLGVHQQSGDYHGTMEVFRKMLDAGFRPDLVTVTTVLPACPPLTALLHAKEIHKYMIANGMCSGGNFNVFENLFVNNTLLDVYVKCGNLAYAYGVFNNMILRDVASWNIMIMGYGMHGHGKAALTMFDIMCENQITPDVVTFIGVLSACSHSGFLSQGREYLSQMKSVYGLVPEIEHYSCVIDMLGRAGQLDEAYQLLITMPIESNDVAWRCFLAACRVHGNDSFAEVAAKKLLELDPDHCGSHVLISNVYGASGRYEEVSDVRLTMREKNIQKNPGYSWIEVNNKVHVFGTGDREHPEANSIYDSLDSLITLLCEREYSFSV